MANNIEIANGGVVEGSGNRFIQFDLSWENGWRTDDLNGDGVTNWDAAWVFVKYRVPAAEGGDDLWKHVWLSTEDGDHLPGSGTPATIDIGLTEIDGTDRGMGAFIYRSQNGAGTFATTGTRLRWDFQNQDVDPTDPIEIRIFAIEMVYVAEGAFSVGDGWTGSTARGHFHQADDPTAPFEIAGEGAITTASSGAENLWGLAGTGSQGCAGGTCADAVAPLDGSDIPADFPKGFDAFYTMKYSVTQQQYVDFLNTLTYKQQDKRSDGNPDDEVGALTNGLLRHARKIATSGTVAIKPAEYETDKPFVPDGWLSWMDGAAYMDWAGLRPMTEFEYEKAARGFAASVETEKAWGNSSTTAAVSIVNAGASDEAASNADANIVFEDNLSAIDVGGPLRVGALANDATDRFQAGASYWGIMELSGNVWERPVTVGNDAGRAFTGLHGDGSLALNGDANVSHWPGPDASGGGFRGGAFDSGLSDVRVSDRFFATSDSSIRGGNYGFRGVRTAPTAGLEQ